MDSIPNGTPLTGKLSARNWPAQFGGRGSVKPALPTPIDVEEEAGLHGHAAAAEPIFIEIVERVAVLVGEKQVVLVVFDNPFGLE